MKTQFILSLTACCLTYSIQAQKPFKELGLDDEVAVITLSNGRYIEHFENDTLRQIGSVMFNTITNKIEYIIPEDDLERVRIAKRDREVSRFLSIDPLAHSFPYYSPYHFCSNSPIVAVDLEGLQSSVQLNYVETSVTITRDGSNRFVVTREQLAGVPHRVGDAGYPIQDLSAGGLWEVWCTDCHGPYRARGEYVTLFLPKQTVTRSVDVIRTANKTEEGSGGFGSGRISYTTTSNGVLVDVGDYSASQRTVSITSITNQFQGGINELNNEPLRELQITSINVQVNASLGEEYRTQMQNQLTAQFGTDVTINVTLDNTMPSTETAFGSIDYQYTETVTEEVVPVVITP
jgi:hypothetical protein